MLGLMEDVGTGMPRRLLQITVALGVVALAVGMYGCQTGGGGGGGGGGCAEVGEACTADADCCEGLVCDPDTEVCAEAPVDLCADVECEEGEECDPETGECVAVDPCEGVECEEGQECVDGECVAIDPCEGIECEEGEECVDGECVAIDPCEGIECEEGQECVDGVCVDIDLCEGVECDEGFVCDPETGDCIEVCIDDAACDDEDMCTVDTCGEDGLCVNAPVECPEGEECDAETGECVAVEPPAEDDLVLDNGTIPFEEMVVGETYALISPDPTAATDFTRQPPADCTCAWSVTPATAGMFSAADACTTDFTVEEEGAFQIMVVVTCAAEETTYLQDGMGVPAPVFGVALECPEQLAEGVAGDFTATISHATGEVTVTYDVISGNATVDADTDGLAGTVTLNTEAGATIEATATDDMGTPDDDTDDVTATGTCSIAGEQATLKVELGPDRIFTLDAVAGGGTPFQFNLAIFSDDNDAVGEQNEFPEDINCVAADTSGEDLEVRRTWTVISVPPGMDVANVVLLSPLNTTDLRVRINTNATATVKGLRGNATEVTSALGRVVPGVYTFACQATTDADPVGVTEEINITIADPFDFTADGTENDVAATTPTAGQVTHVTTIPDSIDIEFTLKSVIAGAIQWILNDNDKDATFDQNLNTSDVSGDTNDEGTATTVAEVSSATRGSYTLDGRFTDATGTGDADTAQANTAVNVHVTTALSGTVDMRASTSTITGFGLVSSGTAGPQVHGARQAATGQVESVGAHIAGATVIAYDTPAGADIAVGDVCATVTGGRENVFRITADTGAAFTITPALGVAIADNDVIRRVQAYDGTAATCCDINADGYNELITVKGALVSIFSAVNTNVKTTGLDENNNANSPVDNSYWHLGVLAGDPTVDPAGLDIYDPLLDTFTVNVAGVTLNTATDIVCCDLNKDTYNDLAIGFGSADTGTTNENGVVAVYYNVGQETGTRFEQNPYSTLANGWDEDGANLAPGAVIRRPDGAAADDRHFGHSLACCDLNADAIDDLIIGAPTDGTTAWAIGAALANPIADAGDAITSTTIDIDNGAGAAADVSMMTAGTLLIVDRGGGQEYYKVVTSANTGGGNGFGQITVTPPLYAAVADNDTFALVNDQVATGLVWVVNGLDHAKLSNTTLTSDGTNAGARVLVANREPGDLFGVDLACGDFSGDGVADIIVGAPGWTNNAATPNVNAGGVFVVNGGGSFGGVNENPNSRYEGQASYLGLGRTVDIVDLDGNGNEDIITGAVNGSNTLALANTKGRITVIAGGTSQIFGDSAAGTLDALPKMVGASSDSYMGARLCVGDFGSDTVNDVLVTLPAADNGNHQVMLVNGVNPLPATLTPVVTFDNLDTSTPDAFLTEPTAIGALGADADTLNVFTAAYIGEDYDQCVICDVDGDGAGDLFWQGLDGGALGEAYLIHGWVDSTP